MLRFGDNGQTADITSDDESHGEPHSTFRNREGSLPFDSDVLEVTGVDRSSSRSSFHGIAVQFDACDAASLRTESPAGSISLAPPSLPEATHRLRWKVYNKLIASALAINFIVTLAAIAAGWWRGPAAIVFISTAAQVNFVVAVLSRQQYVINFVGWLATRPSTRWPLRIRWMLGKYYHLGGLHVGTGLAGALWSVVLMVFVIYDRLRHIPVASKLNIVLEIAIVFLLLIMVVTALPSFRSSFHDHFEITHRFGAWSILALSWANSLVFAVTLDPGASISGAIVDMPTTWLLALSTSLAVWPWILLRKVPITVVHRSKHVAIIQLAHDIQPGVGTTRAISLSPLFGWHQFGIVPPVVGSVGYRMIVSRAGDWTSAFVDTPPDHVWVRGLPTVGVANARRLFKKVVFLLTGSGIGPGLSHLLAGEQPTKLVWVTKNPRRTYGVGLLDDVLRAQPDALIWNTDERGKPDVLALTYQAYVESGAEAVICICNKQVTWQVVHGMEQRGIPAFGPIWDS